MAVSAAFIRMRRRALATLASAVTSDNPQELTSLLMATGTSVVEFDGNAEIFPVLLSILTEDYDIDLETSENAIVSELAEICTSLVFILTTEEQEKYLDMLTPEQFSAEDLADAYEDFTEDDEEGAGAAMLAGIAALHQALSEVDDEHVVVVTVG